jgi:aldehyde:ferredoxin oxidoreductase
MKGYSGTIVRVDLSECRVRREKLPPELIRDYIGGKGLGLYLNSRENPADIDPLSASNKIIFVTGPGAGTILPTATRIGLFAKAPLNSVCIDSYLGGSFGHFMKKAGYDALIVEGRAPSPVYISIRDDTVSIEEAASLWGKDIYATEETLKIEMGKEARVLSIGPGGEHLVRYAGIGHEKHRHFGRMGSGAIMGAKNLKAIALIGTGTVDVYDQQGLKQYVRELNKRIKEHPGTGIVYPQAGTVNFVSKANSLGVFPSHYWVKGQAAYADRIDFNAMQQHTLVRQDRCYGCPIGCAHINRVPDGPYAGIEIEGPEFETIYSFGGLCDVSDIRDIIKLNDECDRMGIDTMHTGNILGLLMLATERGRLSGDFEISFSDTEAMVGFIHGIVERDGEWRVLGEGIRSAAEHLGISDLAIHVKGLEPAGYDPRGVQSMAVTYGVGNRGATHLSSNSYARDISGKARDFELSGDDKTVERFSLDRKAELVFNMINFNAIADCFVYCRFLNRDVLTWEDYTESLYLLTGMRKDKEELERIANKIVTIGRQYNVRSGLNQQQDLLPERFYTEPLDSEGARGQTVSRADYNRELRLYYEMRGWNDRGTPSDTVVNGETSESHGFPGTGDSAGKAPDVGGTS